MSQPLPLLAAPDPCPTGLPVTVAGNSYDALLRRLVPAYKDRGVWALRRPLASRAWAAISAVLTAAGPRSNRVVLVPVPSAPGAVRRRGLDTTVALAESAARLARIEGWRCAVSPMLGFARAVSDQSGLDAAGRAANLAGALRLTRRLGRADTDGVLIPLDDVVTTGATLAEAARALRAAGPVLAAVTVAATARRQAPVHRADRRR